MTTSEIAGARRRATLVQPLANAVDGIRCEHIEGTEGAVVFRAACNMGLEGIVAKRRDSRYHSGRSRDCFQNQEYSASSH
jgi:bifunctional non-homologous end joining protein LigD